MKYVKIASWHIAGPIVSRAGKQLTLCGRWAKVDAPAAPGLPSGKSCESCFRVQAEL